jgi:cAMP phosphodiesterase
MHSAKTVPTFEYNLSTERYKTIVEHTHTTAENKKYVFEASKWRSYALKVSKTHHIQVLTNYLKQQLCCLYGDVAYRYRIN